MIGVVTSATLLLVILNPFALSVYLIEVIEEQSFGAVAQILLRASLISGAVFALFAWAGESVFTKVLHVRFGAFQIFGGLVFLIVALRFMLSGREAVTMLRGEPERIAGAVAMPFMIGPGTVSAAILAGLHLATPLALIAIAAALAVTVLVLLTIKFVVDRVRTRNARLVERYVEVTGRIAAILAGTIAIEMIFDGIEGWLTQSPLLHVHGG